MTPADAPTMEAQTQLRGPMPAAEPATQLISPLPGGQSDTTLKKIRYTHDAMIDILLANPAIRQKELATMFGFSEAWVSTVICSDAFQARLAVRRSDLVGNTLLLNFNERMRRMAFKSLERVETELEKQAACDVNVAMDALKLAAKGFGFGGGPQIQVNAQQNNQYVVQLPGKAASATEWAKAYGAEEGGLLAESAASMAVPPLPPALEAACVDEAMDVLPELVPVGQKANV